VPAELEPPALARLVDFAERPRTQDWSLRAALVRYASPQPQRVDDLLQLVRRTDFALGRSSSVLQRDGVHLWDAIEHDTTPNDEEHARVVELLRVARDLDALGDELAEWAVDISRDPPDGDVDATVERVGARLDELGVPHEERPPPRARG
jgi:hypothetical protein